MSLSKDYSRNVLNEGESELSESDENWDIVNFNILPEWESDVSVLSRHVDMAAKIPSLQIQGCGWGKTIATWTVGAPAWVYMDAPSSRIFSDAKDAKEALPMLLDPFATANVSRASGLVASKGKKNLDGLPFAMAKEGGRRRPVTLFITLVETLNVTLVITLVIALDLGLGLGL